MILSSDEDFGILIEALDAFTLSTINRAMSIEVSNVAVAEALKLPKDDQMTEKAFVELVDKSINQDKVKDKKTSIRDKMTILKAKVVMTKEYLRGAKLENEINTLLK
jgi:hypothetical protein